MRKKYFKYLFLIGFIIFSNIQVWAKDRLEPEMFLTITPFVGDSNNVRYYKIASPTLERFEYNKEVMVFWRNNFPIVKGDHIVISAQPATGDSAITFAEIKIVRINKSYPFRTLPFTAKLDTGIDEMIPGDYMIEAYCKMGGAKKCSGILFFTLTESLEDPQAQAVAQAIAQATDQLSKNYQELLKKYSDDQKTYQERQRKYETDLATARVEARSNLSSQSRVEVREVKVVDNSKINELSNKLAQLEKENSNLRNQKTVEKVIVPKNTWTGVFSVKGNGTATVHYDWGDVSSPTTRTVDFKNYMVCSGVMLPCTLTVTLDGRSITRRLENKDKANFYCFDFSGS
ncbi:hypothetical protein COY43_00105 [Candidatus Berkelbacteria bacterium CG_4_10_14_0_8_um_filter_35_9_33_8]|nr:MAG: hypothetical protein COX10_00865 [Candidatus Berkelbacteria bacterium CG23_combo_of_CG06-09_8_20_14_all_33_15]PIS08519.1 MAG: hypothetical protein COT76_00910 [Candidatus Berkelbacteria bacterium CG10_big_fil_rev_8_21_14_0_10_33_10]PIZ28546.1 MAG: hypothetical protein COY43_00105 [Candidatus Berkelbacteria bacterium CG_4_10_14_0_8_um_filter_35_9_33_8]